jgi:hypothetical protein
MATIPNVVDNDLLLTTWGNAVADELNDRTVKVDGTIGNGAAPTSYMTGPLIIRPTATTVPCLRLRRSGDSPYLAFETIGGAVLSTVMGSVNGLIYDTAQATDNHSWRLANVETMRLQTGLLAVPTCSVAARSAVLARSDNANQLILVDQSGGGVAGFAYMGLYPSGTATTSGVRGGYVGFAGAGLQVRADIGDLVLASAAGDVGIVVDGVQQATMIGADFMWGKAASDLANAGVEMFGSGSASEGMIASTRGTAGNPNLYLRRVGAADVNGQPLVQFAHGAAGSTVILSQIEMDTAAPVGIHITNCVVTAPSDYRLKDDLGPVVGVRERVAQLRPRHLAWKESGVDFDGLIAHEVADVVPGAVFGDKDGDTTQQLDQSALIPLLVAGLQLALDRIDQLEAAA